jgi:hypothetical protein
MVENRAAADDITLANLAALGLTTPLQAMPAGPAEASR